MDCARVAALRRRLREKKEGQIALQMLLRSASAQHHRQTLHERVRRKPRPLALAEDEPKPSDQDSRSARLAAVEQRPTAEPRRTASCCLATVCGRSDRTSLAVGGRFADQSAHGVAGCGDADNVQWQVTAGEGVR